MEQSDKDVDWSQRSKRYKINYFAALGQLFGKEPEHDHPDVEAVPGATSEKAKSVSQEKNLPGA